MPGIVLKDRTATAGEYSGVTQMKAPYQDSDGNASKQKFTRLTSLNAYAITQQDDGKYLVQKKLEYIPNEDYFYFGLYDADYQEFASGGFVGLFLTLKTLTVGESYAFTDMY